MAKKKEEKEVIEEVTQEQKNEEKPGKDKTPEVDLSKFKSKDDDSITKVDLSNPPEKNESNIKEEKVEEEVKTEEVVEDKQEENKDVVLEEVTNEEIEEQVEELETKVTDAIVEAEETGKDLPENIQKLMDFMEETGGDINDYVKLNQDYSELDNGSLLKEYYKQTKPHLNSEEIDFLMEDQFSFNEDIDEEIEVKRKKLALKEQVADAKSHLDGLKSKYYKDIKAGSKLTQEQQKAIDFFNRYDKETKEQQAATERQTRTFLNKTNNLFNKQFKGFEYNIGEKKFRYNVKDVDNIKSAQSDLNNFVGKFLDKKNEMTDAKGYHKSLFTAMNPDAIASHFYEQGKADALKNSVAKSKNISMDPRQQHSGDINTGGIKVRMLGDDSSGLKFKIKNKR